MTGVMSDAAAPLGSLCIVLHGHLPYVLHHGLRPHGEAWLYEAVAEVYLPLADMIGEVALHKVRPGLTIGLTPVLLEQLAHPTFKAGFVAYLNERIERAAADGAAFEAAGESHFAFLAERYRKCFARLLDRFEALGRDLIKPFADRCREGHVQLLTSAATHAYGPLLLRDESFRAQLACGIATSERHLGFRPRGMWLPECAYRPASDAWAPPVLDGPPRPRAGLETLAAAAGVDHFFVDTHLVARSQPLGTVDAGGQFRETNPAVLHWDVRRAWGSPLDPVGVAGATQAPRCFALARHPRVSEQVWSGTIGYPGSGEYLDFHRKHGGHDGLRYHRVTSVATPLHEKQPYDPDETHAKLYEHSQHFCSVVRDVLKAHRDATGRPGVCVAPFDAELFGHWWAEGQTFLKNVILTLAHDRSPERVLLTTAEEALERFPPDKVVRMPEGSWGEGGDHRVWLNEQTRWMWEVEHRAEDRIASLVRALPWRTNTEVCVALERAGRELLLLQASDWPFVVHSRGAVDYGYKRFAGHSTRFDRLTQVAEDLSRGTALSDMQRAQVAEADAHDGIFPTIDLAWWSASA